MASADFIPTGRTSLVKRGDVKLQVQTEYAYRPVPRITSTILKSGQVVHKVERLLDNPITSLEEKSRMEETIRKQHAEILSIIQKQNAVPGLLAPVKEAEDDGFPDVELAVLIEDEPEIEEEIEIVEEPEDSDTFVPTPDPVLSTEEQLKAIPGIKCVYRLDFHGHFHNANLKGEFKKRFSGIFKNLSEMLTVFTEIPGVGLNREQGIYEIERDRLYLVSSGVEFFICYLNRPHSEVNYERAIRAVLPQQDVW